MEAVERRAANHRPAIEPGRFLAVHEARLKIGPAQFQGIGTSVQNLEWCEVTDVRHGTAVLVPAACVMFPYVAPSGYQINPRPCTTGLASGNSRLEAVVHALLELIERHSISSDLRQPVEKCVAAAVLQDVAGDLIARIESAGFEVYVSEVDIVPSVPTYVARMIPKAELVPNIIAAGQAADLDPRRAIERALLEAVQSRVVATLGNREDLVRHISHWEGTFEGLVSSWNARKSAAIRRGTVDSLHTSNPASTLGDALFRLQEALSRIGFDQVLAADVTEEDIGIPVIRVMVPGMLDDVSRGSS
jgi:ribosomal protein S12 methylthiotransferase accessory factor